jgi:pantothenate kinase
MLAAPPGAGKSTLLSFLEMLANEHRDMDDIQVIGMDGFHRRQEYLQTHYVTRNGRQISMVDIKGAPVTFDLDKLTERVKKVSAGEICRWPVYDRMLHNPVEDAIRIDGDIIILEGNYLLLDEDGWRELHNYADYTISIKAEEELLRKRLIDRRMKTGVGEDAATRFVDYSDMPNVRLCLTKTMPSDLQFSIASNGEYT